MAALLALVATILTSLLPILNKRLLRDARPALVAWVVNAASLPILLAGTLLLTQCSVTSLHGSIPFSCTARLPHVDGIFVAALVASALLAWPTLDETPGFRQSIGVAVVLGGAYLLEVEEARTGLLAPVRMLLRRPGILLAIVASALWGATTVLEKLAIEHVTPPSGPLVALLGTFLLVVFLTPGVFRSSRPEKPSPTRGTWQGLRPHVRALFAAIALAGVAPLFGFSAIALGLVGYVTTLFKLSAVLTILWAWWFLGEGQIRSRLLGAGVMIVGGLLVAV